VKRAAVGFRAHSGWTALVAVSVEKGPPSVLVRKCVDLVETFSYEFRQPYHTAGKMPLTEAREFISRVRTKARHLAYCATRELQSDLRKLGYELTHCGLLLASGKPLPHLSRILASHALIHTADGELFREAILHAGARSGLKFSRIKERELLERSEQAFRLKSADLQRLLTEIGRPLGSPWSQDEKFSMLAAWLALAADAPRGRKTRRGSPAA
jgi:hypothetical protein